MSSNICIVGNVTRPPELRYVASGTGVASFGVAVNRRFQRNGEWEESVSFFDVTAWGTLGEHASASLDKGTRVIVSGRLEQRSWEGQDGEKKSKIEIVADAVGPDLRWASVEINRVDRSKPSESPAGQPAPKQEYSEEPF